MKVFHLLLLASLAALATGVESPDAQTIIERSVAVNQQDWKAEPQYSHLERDLHGAGPAKTYRVMMISDSPYEELIAVDDKPLSATEQASENQKLEKAKTQRQTESTEERQQRVAKYLKERTRDQLMMEQLTKAFDFKLVGHSRLNGHSVYVLEGTPRKGYKPPNMQTEALTGMNGKLWIDQASFQWVRVEASVIHAVSIEGVLARVEPGTHFELEKMAVGNNIWLPKHFSMKSRARILGMIPNNQQEDDVFSEYSTGN